MKNLKSAVDKIARSGRKAALSLQSASLDDINRALHIMAEKLAAAGSAIKRENAKDIAAAKIKKLSPAMIDRLTISDKTLASMIRGLLEVAELSSPVGKEYDQRVRPNGLEIFKLRVPIGVVCIIFESRPNVTVDAAAICLKSGNAVILRGGSEALHSNLALVKLFRSSCVEAGLPGDAVQAIPVTDRAAIDHLLKLDQQIDLVIPRGGEGLIRMVAEKSLIPVIKHYKGVCHIYVDRAANQEMALKIIDNAKCQRPGTCNAAEKVLVHRDIAAAFAPRLAELFHQRQVEMRGDPAFCQLVPDAKPATAEDWTTEYLDLIITVAVVDSFDAAVAHIATYGSAHSDAIITQDKDAAMRFTEQVDSAAVYVNASTRFTDGGQFGMGAEIGISTDRIHARGPMGLEELTSYKYIVLGNGQVRA